MLYYGLILSLQKKMENWKFINANYEVSDKGNIKSVNYRGTGKSAIRKQSISKNGYMRVILSDNGKNKHISFID